MEKLLPKLITFDGDARSGKGTIVSLVKDYLRDQGGHSVMLIDAGQVFRVLVLAMDRAGIDLDSSTMVDAYLADGAHIAECAHLVKEVYRMTKEARETLLYTSEVSEKSAKVGACPRSQAFKDELVRKWLSDARQDGYDVVLLDGRSLEEVGEALEQAGLCKYVLGLFFVCDPIVSAQRTLGWMPVPYEQLSDEKRQAVDELVRQIVSRNRADRERAVQPVREPVRAPRYDMLHIPPSLPARLPRPMAIIDRSIEIPFDAMTIPFVRLIEAELTK